MEEFVGELWHRLITRQAATEYRDARVELASLSQQLAPFYRALGGAPGKVVEGAVAQQLNFRRSLLQRMAGSHRRTSVAWQDERSLRLPPVIALFADKKLNEDLYFWLAALAAQLSKTNDEPKISHWFVDNQRATQDLLETRPGLASSYQSLLEASLALRPRTDTLTGANLARELAIRQALKHPGSAPSLPLAAGDPQPIPLWLYPAPPYLLAGNGLRANPEDEPLEPAAKAQQNTVPKKIAGPRKAAQHTDDAKKTDGLLVFMLDSLFSWSEHVDVDRCQDESLDQNAAAIAEDLDIITLSRHRRAGSAKLKFDLDLPAPQNDDLVLGEGMKLPEWDYRTATLRADYCLLQPMLADDAQPAPVPEPLRETAAMLRHRFSALQFQPSWMRRQPFGSELDLDACVECVTEPERQLERQDLYRDRSQRQRSLSCLLLADLSMSTDAGLNAKQRVIDVIRDSILLFAEALSASSDRFAIYGFSSVKNKQVRYQLLKNFAEPYSDATRGRILAIKPGFYTRMGAAIRQSTEVLALSATEQRLLLIISDGKPNDIDQYEGRYGVEDTRHAVLAAKRLGIQPFCITIDERGNDYLPYLFGDQGFAVISDTTRLPTLLPKLYLTLTGRR